MPVLRDRIEDLTVRRRDVTREGSCDSVEIQPGSTRWQRCIQKQLHCLLVAHCGYLLEVPGVDIRLDVERFTIRARTEIRSIKCAVVPTAIANVRLFQNQFATGIDMGQHAPTKVDASKMFPSSLTVNLVFESIQARPSAR